MAAVEGARDTLDRRIEEIPKPLLDRVRQGYRALSSVSTDDAKAVVAELAEKIADRAGPQPSDVSAIVDVDSRSAETIMLAVSVSLAMILDLPVTADDFIEAASGAMIDSADASSVRLVFDEISKNKSSLKERVEEGIVSNSLLPSLMRFDVEIDVRFRFEDGNLKHSVPVALVHIDTDVDRQEIFFQLRKAEVQSMIDKLSTAMIEMEIAASLVKGERRG